MLGSHNSWSYLKPKKWWMKILGFTAKCQSADIREQYELHGVRCFDLRVKFNGDVPQVAHGLIEYDYTHTQLFADLDYLNSKGDVVVRVLHEARNLQAIRDRGKFFEFCSGLEKDWTEIKFWCGRNLFNWTEDYQFQYNPSCEEKYASVCVPKFIDDWWPWLFARRNNRKILEAGTTCDILLIDFVNIRS